MLRDFFQILPLPADQLTGQYDMRLVALSFFVAVFASYIALDMTGRLRDRSNTAFSTRMWLLGGSIAMGAGIWAMHFIGMLSFSIPGLALRYDTFWTLFSLIVAIGASGFALYLLKAQGIRLEHYVAGGVVLGFGIAAMHYTGMEGLLIALHIRYLPFLFLISIIIAIVASEAALWLALKSHQVILSARNRIKLISAIIMGIAICGMHYTGMSASVFTPLCTPVETTAATTGQSMDPGLLAIAIAGIAIVILSIAYFVSSFKEAANVQQLEKARQLGMAEISASVLHNVGNVLNSVVISTGLLIEKNANTKLSGLEQINKLLNEQKGNLSEFFASENGENFINYIQRLTEYWRDEKKFNSDELLQLSNNLKLIKEIISTQQDLSKLGEFEQLTSLREVLDEVLLITGLQDNNNIQMIKDYGKVNPFIVDKVKLLHVVVNMLRNAKDAVSTAPVDHKKITLKTSQVNNKVIIEISDNGTGIEAKNLDRIFNYGFTTKETGHGFGLHTSALAIHAMGGEISVTSPGRNKGTTFKIQLPYKKPK